MKQQRQLIHKSLRTHKRTAKTAMSCLMLLLLYGCAYQGQTAPAVTALPVENDTGAVIETPGGTDDTDAADRQTETVLPSADAATAAGTDMAEGTISRAGKQLAVYVCGAVAEPGVYELPEGSRVYEAVALAGGMTDEASQTAVNQAERLTDGQMIEIPTREQQQEKAAAEEAHADGLVNINTADLEELKTLPGIGDSKARSIIAYREKNGPFGVLEDIKHVDGIGDGVFAKLEGCIKVD